MDRKNVLFPNFARVVQHGHNPYREAVSALVAECGLRVPKLGVQKPVSKWSEVVNQSQTLLATCLVS